MTQAAQGAVRLEGDVITANGSILSGQVGNHGDTISLDDETSVCSCCCSGFQKKRRRPRFTVRRSPGKISHLLPMQQLPTLNVRSDLRPPPLTPLLQLPPLHQHRASIWRPSAGVGDKFSQQQQQLPRRVSVWEPLPLLPRRNKKDGQISRKDVDRNGERVREENLSSTRFNEFQSSKGSLSHPIAYRFWRSRVTVPQYRHCLKIWTFLSIFFFFFVRVAYRVCLESGREDTCSFFFLWIV